MIEKHPIDDLFKGLAEAEVVPPAAVWEGIITRQSWSERLLVSIRKYWWVPLLFLLFTGAGIGAAISNNDMGMASMSSASLHSAVPQEVSASNTFHAVSASQGSTENSSTMASSADNGSDGLDRAVESSERPPSTLPGSSAAQAGTDSNPGRTALGNSHAEGQAGSDEPSNVNGAGTPATTNEPTFGTTPRRFNGISQSIDDVRVLSNDEVASMMEIRESEFSSNPPSRPGTRKGKPYTTAGSIPPSDWWVGGSIGYYHTSLDYEGSNTALQDALSQGESGSHSVVVEALVGRIWRNGFFVSTGLGTESVSSKAAYSEVLRVGIYSPQDSSVLLAIVDSTFNYAATNRYSLIRVPLTAGWQQDIGRFEFGVQGGVLFELGAGRKGYTLTTGPSPDDISAGGNSAQYHVVRLEESELNARYGVGLSATAGLHLGYKVNEFFSVWASPEYSTRLSTLSNDPLQMKTSRAGLRLGIRYILPY